MSEPSISFKKTICFARRGAATYDLRALKWGKGGSAQESWGAGFETRGPRWVSRGGKASLAVHVEGIPHPLELRAIRRATIPKGGRVYPAGAGAR